MSKQQCLRTQGGFVVKQTPGRVHGSFDKAAAEAVRISEAKPGGPAFMVMQIVGIVAEGRADG